MICPDDDCFPPLETRIPTDAAVVIREDRDLLVDNARLRRENDRLARNFVPKRRFLLRWGLTTPLAL